MHPNVKFWDSTKGLLLTPPSTAGQITLEEFLASSDDPPTSKAPKPSSSRRLLPASDEGLKMGYAKTRAVLRVANPGQESLVIENINSGNMSTSEYLSSRAEDSDSAAPALDPRRREILRSAFPPAITGAAVDRTPHHTVCRNVKFMSPVEQSTIPEHIEDGQMTVEEFLLSRSDDQAAAKAKLGSRRLQMLRAAFPPIPTFDSLPITPSKNRIEAGQVHFIPQNAETHAVASDIKRRLTPIVSRATFALDEQDLLDFSIAWSPFSKDKTSSGALAAIKVKIQVAQKGYELTSASLSEGQLHFSVKKKALKEDNTRATRDLGSKYAVVKTQTPPTRSDTPIPHIQPKGSVKDLKVVWKQNGDGDGDKSSGDQGIDCVDDSFTPSVEAIKSACATDNDYVAAAQSHVIPPSKHYCVSKEHTDTNNRSLRLSNERRPRHLSQRREPSRTKILTSVDPASPFRQEARILGNVGTVLGGGQRWKVPKPNVGSRISSSITDEERNRLRQMSLESLLEEGRVLLQVLAKEEKDFYNRNELADIPLIGKPSIGEPFVSPTPLEHSKSVTMDKVSDQRSRNSPSSTVSPSTGTTSVSAASKIGVERFGCNDMTVLSNRIMTVDNKVSTRKESLMLKRQRAMPNIQGRWEHDRITGRAATNAEHDKINKQSIPPSSIQAQIILHGGLIRQKRLHAEKVTRGVKIHQSASDMAMRTSYGVIGKHNSRAGGNTLKGNNKIDLKVLPIHEKLVTANNIYPPKQGSHSGARHRNLKAQKSVPDFQSKKNYDLTTRPATSAEGTILNGYKVVPTGLRPTRGPSSIANRGRAIKKSNRTINRGRTSPEKVEKRVKEVQDVEDSAIQSLERPTNGNGEGNGVPKYIAHKRYERGMAWE